MDAPEIDYRAELPPHRQIATWLHERIDSGELASGQPVPSEKDLMDLFGVARTTVRRAIAYLRDQGAIRTVPGPGKLRRQARVLTRTRSLTASLRLRGLGHWIERDRSRLRDRVPIRLRRLALATSGPDEWGALTCGCWATGIVVSQQRSLLEPDVSHESQLTLWVAAGRA